MSLTTKGRVVVALLVLGGIVLAAAAGGYLYLSSIGVYGSSDPGRKVTIEIPQGSSASSVGSILAEEGVIKSAMGFRIAAYLDGGFEQIQAGEYELRTGLTARDALEALIESGPKGEETFSLTFQEGLWLTEMADKIEAETDLSGEKFLQLIEDGRVTSPLLPDGGSMEGLLFPSTYSFFAKDNERAIAQKMVDEMTTRAEQLGLADNDFGLTPYEVIIVASMIEAETRMDAERPMVARVIYNRLEQGIALGIDATYLYALEERNRSLTVSDLAIESPYNLRTNLGLPPTPIGAPGQASLEAAMSPAEGEWIFYVLEDCEGNHAFSVTNEEFLQNKAAYQALSC